MLNLIPWPYRMLAVAVALLAAAGFGWVKGADYEQSKAYDFKTQVVTAGSVQQTKNEAVVKRGAQITKQTGDDYAKVSHDIRGMYGPGRVLNSDTGSGETASVPDSPGKVDGVPADSGPSAIGESSECKALRSDAAVTTLQLLFLQDWILQQAENYGTQQRDTGAGGPATEDNQPTP